MKYLDFPYPFSGFRTLDFTNCFTCIYMYLEGMRGSEDYACVKKQGKSCDGCGNCWQSAGNLQGRLFFLFDTVSGRSATVNGWGGKPTAIYSEIYDTENMIEFLTGYAGYTYEKYQDSLMEHISASIDADTPVLARMKDSRNGSFRVITGYDGNRLFTPKPADAQEKPKKSPRLGEIDSVYAITGKTEPKYALLDGLRRIKRVMEADREAGVWDEYIHAFEHYWDRLKGHSLKELKQLHEYAWKGTTWNCHNFAEAFRIFKDYERAPEIFANPIWHAFTDPCIREQCERIDWACDNSHTHQWQLHSLYETRNWKKKYYNEMEWGMCENAAAILRLIKEDDDIVYHAVCEMIGVLS